MKLNQEASSSGDTPRIAVIDLMNADQPSAGVAILRALRSTPGLRPRLIGLATTPFDSGVFLDGLVDARYHLPLTGDDEELLDTLDRIVQREGLDRLIPGSVNAVRRISRIHMALGQRGIATTAPAPENLDKLEGAGFFSYCEQAGLKFRRLHQHPPEEPGFDGEPLRVWTAGGKTFNVANQLELEFFLPLISTEERCQWQRTPAGTVIQAALFADELRRIRYLAALEVISKADDGTVWMGATFTDKRLERLARQLTGKLNWTGVLRLDLIRSAQGQYVVMGASAAPPNWIIPAHHGGASLVERLIGRRPESDSSAPVWGPPGLLVAHYAKDVAADLNEFSALIAGSGVKTRERGD